MPLISIESTPSRGDAASDGSELSARAAEPFFSVDKADGGVPPPLDVVERAYVARVLSYTAGRRLAAAHLLGISYPTFLKRVRELGLDHAVPRREEAPRT